MLKRSASRILVLTVAALVSVWNPDTGNAADPFYDRLLHDGLGAYDNGDYPLAAGSLRLACFGLLDEPMVLARGLTYLALAQAAIDDEPAFIRTFGRIIEIELRFQAFSQLELDPDLRRTYDAHLQRWIALDELSRAPVFRPVARAKFEAQVRELTPEERRSELERLVAAEPEDSSWRLLLAELELESDEFDAVLTATGEMLTRDPQLERALCLRARANAATGRCELALADLDSCYEFADRMVLTETKLRCLVHLRDWQGAAALLNEIPPGGRNEAPFRQLGHEIRKGLADE